jgi:hypothetical protein
MFAMMRKLTLLTLLFLSVCSLAQTVAVSGTLQTMGPSGPNPGSNNDFVVFRLKNWQGDLPRVIGVGPIDPLSYTITPDSSGNFSTTFYGNDQITPLHTYYVFEQWHDGKIQSSANYQFCVNANCTQGLAAKCPCNINTQPPLAASPNQALNVAPLLTLNNIWTGTNTFNGPTIFNSSIVFNSLINTCDLNGALIVSAGCYSTPQLAINALPGSGGTVLVAPGTYSGPTSIPNSNTSIECATWLGCTFTYTTNLALGNGTSILRNIKLDGIIFDFGGTAHGIIMTSLQYSEFRIQVQNSSAVFPAAALLLTATNTAGSFYENKFDWLSIQTGGGSLGTGLILNGDQNISGCGGTQVGAGAVFYNQFHFLTIGGQASGPSADAIDFTSGADSNDFGLVSVILGTGNTTGHAVNFGTRCPSSYGDIVFEHFFTLSANAIQAGYTGPFIQYGDSEGAIDNYVCGTNCSGSAFQGFDPTALAAGLINWNVQDIGGNIYSLVNPVWDMNNAALHNELLMIPLPVATASNNYSCPVIKLNSAQWTGSANTYSDWALSCTLAASGVPTFENLNLTYQGPSSNVNFILGTNIKLALSGGGFNAFFSGNSSMTASVTLTTPLKTGTLVDGSSSFGFMQAASASGVATTGGAAWTGASSSPVSWPTPFTGAYNAVCTGDGVASGVPIYQGTTGQVAGGITVITQQATAATASFSTVECIGYQ